MLQVIVNVIDFKMPIGEAVQRAAPASPVAAGRGARRAGLCSGTCWMRLRARGHTIVPAAPLPRRIRSQVTPKVMIVGAADSRTRGAPRRGID